MKNDKKPVRCAIYTRKSTQEGLEQEFNSLDAQREAGEAYIKSQKHEHWTLLPKHYDDGGFSGGSMERPALHELIADIRKGFIDVVVVYKVDRLSRSLHDFARLLEIFEKYNVSFVSVTQQFNTTSSMGRLTLNILLSFAQFEREVIGERVRDKVAASRRKGMWMGGTPPLGYGIKDKKLYVVPEEAERVRFMFREYLLSASTTDLIKKLKIMNIRTKSWTSIKTGKHRKGGFYNKGMLYKLLHCRTYIGEAVHKDKSYPGIHEAIISRELFDKVQKKLCTQNRKSEYGRHPAQGLLRGIIFDAEGRAYSPVCLRRRGKTYKYYVSQKAIKEGYDSTKGIKNIRMGDLDALVIKQTQSLLPKGWDNQTTQEKRDVLRQYIEKILIHEDRVDLLLKTENGTEMSSIPVHLRRCGNKKLILDAEGRDAVPVRGNKDPALIRALVRAHKWEKMLTSDRAVSLRSIAKMEDHEHRYVARIYQLNFLAPRIKEAILDGIQPKSLTLTKLKQGIPLNWQEQYRLYGF